MKKKKRLFLFLFVALSLSSFFSCSIYKSADRNNFETDSPSIKIKSLRKTSCSGESIAREASYSRLITVVADEFVWQHDVNEVTYFESTNLKGTYCFYDVTLE